MLTITCIFGLLNVLMGVIVEQVQDSAKVIVYMHSTGGVELSQTMSFWVNHSNSWMDSISNMTTDEHKKNERKDIMIYP